MHLLCNELNIAVAISTYHQQKRLFLQYWYVSCIYSDNIVFIAITYM